MLLLLALLACDPYSDVVRENSIEAYEAYLTEHGEGPNALRARVRLEELMLEKARKSGDLADWDAYLARFPDGMHHEAAVAEREASLYGVAERDMTVAAWERYLEAYPKGPADHVRFARRALDAVRYAETTKQGEVRVFEVNLAQDPNGPKDGWGFDMDVTNGDKVVEALWYRIHYTAADGSSLGHRDWPLVAPLAEFPVPVPDEWTVPLQPGETRTWHWTTGDLPEAWAKTARVVPFKVRFAPEVASAAP